jgi:hypothetical protein
MRKPGHGRLTWRTAIAAAAALAAVVAGGGYALASTDGGNGPMQGGNGISVLYLTGPRVDVDPHSNGEGAAMCPRDMYPIGGGLSSSRGVWEIQWSYADSSGRRSRHPDEWTVGLFNNRDSRADFRVFVVCIPANSANGNS